MARIRSLHPSFPLRLQHVGVHAQNLALLLPLVCDDAGRVRLEHRKICDVLYPGPGQNDMAAQLDGLIVELEQEGWVERYSVDGADYLRMIEWDKDQKVVNPTGSRLPPSPREPLDNYRIIESARNLKGRERKRARSQALAGETPGADEKKFFSGDAPIVVTPQSLVRELQQIGDDAREDGQHGAKSTEEAPAARDCEPTVLRNSSGNGSGARDGIDLRS